LLRDPLFARVLVFTRVAESRPSPGDHRAEKGIVISTTRACSGNGRGPIAKLFLAPMICARVFETAGG
jgi:hypothetical protein